MQIYMPFSIKLRFFDTGNLHRQLDGLHRQFRCKGSNKKWDMQINGDFSAKNIG